MYSALVQVQVCGPKKGEEQFLYLMSVDVITRVTRPAPTDTHHYGIVLHNQGRCAEEKKIKTRSLVTMNTTARIPNCKFYTYFTFVSLLLFSSDLPQVYRPVPRE